MSCRRSWFREWRRCARPFWKASTCPGRLPRLHHCHPLHSSPLPWCPLSTPCILYTLLAPWAQCLLLLTITTSTGPGPSQVTPSSHLANLINILYWPLGVTESFSETFRNPVNTSPGWQAGNSWHGCWSVGWEQTSPWQSQYAGGVSRRERVSPFCVIKLWPYIVAIIYGGMTEASQQILSLCCSLSTLNCTTYWWGLYQQAEILMHWILCMSTAYVLGMGHDFRIFYLILEYRLGCAIIF